MSVDYSSVLIYGYRISAEEVSASRRISVMRLGSLQRNILMALKIIL